jgi:hypothetical protein
MNETLVQQAYKNVKQRICEGAIKTGDLLTERTLQSNPIASGQSARRKPSSSSIPALSRCRNCRAI